MGDFGREGLTTEDTESAEIFQTWIDAAAKRHKKYKEKLTTNGHRDKEDIRISGYQESGHQEFRLSEELANWLNG